MYSNVDESKRRAAGALFSFLVVDIHPYRNKSVLWLYPNALYTKIWEYICVLTKTPFVDKSLRKLRVAEQALSSASTGILITWGRAHCFLTNVILVCKACSHSIWPSLLTKSPPYRLLNILCHPGLFFLIQRFIKLSATLHKARKGVDESQIQNDRRLGSWFWWCSSWGRYHYSVSWGCKS